MKIRGSLIIYLQLIRVVAISNVMRFFRYKFVVVNIIFLLRGSEIIP